MYGLVLVVNYNNPLIGQYNNPVMLKYTIWINHVIVGAIVRYYFKLIFFFYFNLFFKKIPH